MTNPETQTEKFETRTQTIPCFDSHIEALEKLSDIVTVEPKLILSAMILEELEALENESLFSISYALRFFTLPPSETVFSVSSLVWEHIEKCAEAIAVAPERLAAWCISRRCQTLSNLLKEHESCCHVVYGLGKDAEIQEITETAIALGISLHRENPKMGIVKNDVYHNFGIGADTADLLNHEHQFIHLTDMDRKKTLSCEPARKDDE